VGILTAIAGTVVLAYSGIERGATGHLVDADLATVRDAMLRFRRDCGQPPAVLAELMQDPDPGAGDGWWWRSDYPELGAAPLPTDLHDHDQATARGWRGPYLDPAWTAGGEDAGREYRFRDGDADGVGEAFLDFDDDGTPEADCYDHGAATPADRRALAVLGDREVRLRGDPLEGMHVGPFALDERDGLLWLVHLGHEEGPTVRDAIDRDADGYAELATGLHAEWP